jgi:hypothetical protein
MEFVEATGGVAAIGALEDIAGMVAGTAGTQVRSDGTGGEGRPSLDGWSR